MREFTRVNDLVKQAEKHGITLADPDGRTYRYCPILVVMLKAPLGDILDFSADVIVHRLQAGTEAAREAYWATPKQPPGASARGWPFAHRVDSNCRVTAILTGAGPLGEC